MCLVTQSCPILCDSMDCSSPVHGDSPSKNTGVGCHALFQGIFPTQGLNLGVLGFLAVMYGCENWTIKKAECRRIDAFELWCWRRLLRVPWTSRRSNQSILKDISPGCSMEGLMLKLKLQYFGHLMRRADSFEKTLMLGKIEGGRKRGSTEDEMVGWHHRLDGHEFE